MAALFQGKVKWFSDHKSFGFIEQHSGNDVFILFSVIQGSDLITLKKDSTCRCK